MEKLVKAEDKVSEARRLEQLWSGDFGNAYLDRNRTAGENRGPFWQKVMSHYQPLRVLEVGCNVGANLRWITSLVSAQHVYGVDINLSSLEELQGRLPGVNTVWSPARNLPFRDRCFDLVFTVGVLIHQPAEMLPLVMGEIVRCSRRFVLCAEYFSAEPMEVSYRGQSGALFKRDFGGLYQQLFPDLTLCEQGFLARAEGWDDVTYWMFARAQE